MTKNQIDYQNSVELKRANMAREEETARANQVNEALTRMRDEETKRSNLAREAETHRANVAQETETNRSNLAREIENNRHNLRTEAITREGNYLDYNAKIYSANTSAAASAYSADKSYQSRVDSAYINKYGVSPTTVKDVVDTVSNAGKASGKYVAAGIVATGNMVSGLATAIQTNLKGGTSNVQTKSKAKSTASGKTGK